MANILVADQAVAENRTNTAHFLPIHGLRCVKEVVLRQEGLPNMTQNKRLGLSCFPDHSLDANTLRMVGRAYVRK